MSLVSSTDGDVDFTVAVEVLVSEVEGIDSSFLEAFDDSVVDETRLWHGVPEVAKSLVKISHNDCESGGCVESFDGKCNVSEDGGALSSECTTHANSLRMLGGVLDHGGLMSNIVTTVHNEVEDVWKNEGFAADDDQFFAAEGAVVEVECSLIGRAHESGERFLLVDQSSFLVIEDESVIVIYYDGLGERLEGNVGVVAVMF